MDIRRERAVGLQLKREGRINYRLPNPTWGQEIGPASLYIRIENPGQEAGIRYRRAPWNNQTCNLGSRTDEED
jgi:hypothetical protein